MHAVGREVVRHRRERGEVQDGRLRAAGDFPSRSSVAGRKARALGAGQGSCGGRAAVVTASGYCNPSIPTATSAARVRANGDGNRI